VAYNCHNPHLLIYQPYVLYRLKDFRFSSKILARYSYICEVYQHSYVRQVLNYFLRRRMKVWKILKSIWLENPNLVFSILNKTEEAGVLLIWVYCVNGIFN